MSAAVDRWEDANLACGRTRRVEARGCVVSEFVLTAEYVSAEHAHALPGIVVPLAGDLRLRLGRVPATVGVGEALMLPGGIAHGERTAAPLRCLLVEWSSGAATDWPGLFDRPVRISHPDLAEAGRRMAERLGTGGAPAWEHEYGAVELTLLVEQARVGLQSDDADSPSWAARATERLRAEFRAPPPLGDIARDVGVSREHFARRFRQTTGLTVGEFIRRRRVLEAIRLLRDHRLSLASVAAAAGFTDQSHLTRHLRRYVGATPRAARRLDLRD